VIRIAPIKLARINVADSFLPGSLGTETGIPGIFGMYFAGCTSNDRSGRNES